MAVAMATVGGACYARERRIKSMKDKEEEKLTL